MALTEVNYGYGEVVCKKQKRVGQVTWVNDASNGVRTIVTEVKS